MLYTRTGDAGTTALPGAKERVAKTSPRIEALGALDELVAVLGLARAALKRLGDFDVPYKKATARAAILDVEEELFTIMSIIAGSSATRQGATLRFSEETVLRLEAITDAAEKVLPPIRAFVLPGATERSALFDVCRTAARRAERRVLALHENGQEVPEPIRRYLNRLSSAFFALARLAAHTEGKHEESPRYGA